METRNYAFFQNRACEFFPCHKTQKPEDFNCLFCYCPLYALGSACGGNFHYTDTGIKSCEACLYPHRRENYDRIVARFAEIVTAMRNNPATSAQTDFRGDRMKDEKQPENRPQDISDAPVPQIEAKPDTK